MDEAFPCASGQANRETVPNYEKFITADALALFGCQARCRLSGPAAGGRDTALLPATIGSPEGWRTFAGGKRAGINDLAVWMDCL